VAAFLESHLARKAVKLRQLSISAVTGGSHRPTDFPYQEALIAAESVLKNHQIQALCMVPISAISARA
jgi:hypothetical protein